MLFLVLFIITSIIISRFLDKKNMKIASISYAIMFIILLTYFMLISDLNILIDKIGVNNYNVLKEVLIGKQYINIFTIVEIVILLLFIISLIISINKIKEEIEKTVNRENKKIELIKTKLQEKIIKIKEIREERRIYINYCRFRS